ncbi:MAG: ABC transporter permease [Acidimicrobiia bacterium]
MTTYILNRLLQGIAVLIVSVSAIFLLGRLSGDPVALLLPEDAPIESEIEIRRLLGLDRPISVQYTSYVSRALVGDFGRSYFDNRAVKAIILEYLPNTLKLAGVAVVISIVMAIPLGIASAVYRDSWLDRISQALALAGHSMPAFWSAILLIQIFGVWLGWLPTFGSGTFAHILLPAANLALYNWAQISRLTRSAMVETLSEDYIRTARSKGLGGMSVVLKHAFRNALLPIVTIVSLELGGLLGGAVITETVFAWPGIGWLVINAISRRDFPVVQGIIGYVAVIFVILTLLTDVLYTYINPRVRY